MTQFAVWFAAYTAWFDMGKCCQKAEVTQSKCHEQRDFAGGTGLMKLSAVCWYCGHCLFGFICWSTFLTVFNWKNKIWNGKKKIRL